MNIRRFVAATGRQRSNNNTGSCDHTAIATQTAGPGIVGTKK